MAKDEKSALSIDALLEDLSDDGVADSSGSFTLDPKKANEKLRSFALASKHDYLLKIVQFAVASGAPSIDIKARPLSVVIKFDGEPLEQAEMKRLMAHLLSDDLRPENRRYRHLAAGMRGATAASPGAIWFEAHIGQDSYQRIWDEAGWRLEKLNGTQGEPRHIFRLQRSMSSVFSSVGAEISTAFSDGNLTEEEAWLVKAYQYSPTLLTLDGKDIPRPVFGQPRYSGYDIMEDQHPGEAKPPPYLVTPKLIDGLVHPDHHLVEARYVAESPKLASLGNPTSEATVRLGVAPGGPEKCKAWLAIASHLGEPEICFVEDGILIEKKKLEGLCPGFRGVISVATLSKDLTGLNLVEDEKLHKLYAWLFKESEKLCAKALESLALFPIRDRVKAVLTNSSA